MEINSTFHKLTENALFYENPFYLKISSSGLCKGTLSGHSYHYV